MNDFDIHLSAIVMRDKDAFGAWMRGTEAPIRESLRSFVRVVDVEAVLQEALVRVWYVAPRFETDGRPNGLLRLGVRIARNLAISEVRRNKCKPVEDSAHEIAVEPEEPDPMLRAAIVECHEKLPNQPRAAMRARIESGGGDDDATLAERLGMRLNTFLQNIGRARKLLAECLSKKGIEVRA